MSIVWTRLKVTTSLTRTQPYEVATFAHRNMNHRDMNHQGMNHHRMNHKTTHVRLQRSYDRVWFQLGLGSTKSDIWIFELVCNTKQTGWISLFHIRFFRKMERNLGNGKEQKKKKERKETNINLARGPYDHVSYTEQGRVHRWGP